MAVNEHERLSNFTLRYTLSLLFYISRSHKFDSDNNYTTHFQYLMDRTNTFDNVLRTSNLCLKQIKFEVNLKEMLIL